MIELETIKKKMAMMNKTAVAREIGISTWKIWNALKSNKPLYHNVKALSDYLESQENVSCETIQRGA